LWAILGRAWYTQPAQAYMGSSQACDSLLHAPIRLFELPLVVALPELRRRPGMSPCEADGFEALHVAKPAAKAGVAPPQLFPHFLNLLSGGQSGDALDNSIAR
jgi:hypothetical protein